MKMSWASKSVQNNDKTIRNGRLFGFRAPQRLLRFQNASQGRVVCLELSAWSCLFGAVCLELSVWTCLFVCLEGAEH